MVVRGTYGILYAAWALWIVGEISILGQAVWKAAGPGDDFAGEGVLFMAMLFLLVVPLHILLWVVSFRALLDRSETVHEAVDGSESLLPPSAFVQSLAWIFLGALMFGFYLAASAIVFHISTVGR